MCIFNTPVKTVSGTKILVARTPAGRQLVCYRMYASVEFDTHKGGRENHKRLATAEAKLAAQERGQGPTPAMLLPFPLAPDGKPVELVDLSQLPETFFSSLEDCFPRVVTPQPQSRARRLKSKEATKGVLRVERVGSYNVSVARSLEDLHRIDRDVFVVAPNVASILASHYGQGFGFIIAGLRDNEKKHPLGYVHDMPADGHLFVPTRHHHHGDEEEAESDWDHDIFSLSAGPEAGESPPQRASRLEESCRDSKVGARVAEPLRKVEDVLGELPLQVSLQGELRWLSKKGRLANMDTRFSLAMN